MNFLKILIFLFFIQQSFSYSQSFKIQKIELDSSVLKKEITNYINKQKRVSSKFKNFGYIIVKLDFYSSNSNTKPKALSHAYSIKYQYAPLKKESNYPFFFTFINDKIVLLYINKLSGNNQSLICKKSKKRLARKVKKTLGKTERLLALNEKGEKIIDDKNFNPNESFNIHGGIYLKIYSDNTIEIIEN